MDPSESLSSIDVHWKIEKPKLGDWFRTPFFHLRNNELCLELQYRCDGNEREIVTMVVWRRKATSVKWFYTQCHLTVGSEVYSVNRTFEKMEYTDFVPSLVDLILSQNVEISDEPSKDSEEEWTVKCQLSLDEPFDNQVEKKRIHLTTVDDTLSSSSVDKCVQVSSKIPQDMEALSHDLAHLLREEIFPDFKLSCGGETFPVHRCVLGARSKVFRAMFSNQMQESITGLVAIKDLEVPILNLLLKFVYSGKLEDISLETASNLYEAADKYAVNSLMTACSYYMIRNVTVENCVGYLKTAVAHSDTDLKAAVASFIIRHPAVFKSPIWATFSVQHSVLANEVLQAYIASLNQ